MMYILICMILLIFLPPSRILPKIANKAEHVPKKVTVNNIIKTVDTSKNIIKDF